jgi:hypothetical protein
MNILNVLCSKLGSIFDRLLNLSVGRLLSRFILIFLKKSLFYKDEFINFYWTTNFDGKEME